jgi:hypothetical protein
LQTIRRFLRPTVKKLMLVWVVLVLVAAAAFAVLVLPYLRMPDVSNTPWHELARGVAPGDEGAHQPDDPYFILGTNESEISAVAAMKSRLASQRWRVVKDPAPGGGVTFVRNDDPQGANVLLFSSYPNQTLSDLEDYSVTADQLREWQPSYANIYILEMFFP